MRIIELTEETKKDILERLLKRSPSSYRDFEERVNEILQNVKENGDAAVFGYTKQFDGAEITAENVRVTKAELDEAYESIDPGHWRTSAATMRNRDSTAGLTVQKMVRCSDRR